MLRKRQKKIDKFDYFLFSIIWKQNNFDYIYASVLRKENKYFGEKSIYKTVNSVQESWLFGIQKGETESFLHEYNLKLIQNLDSADLEKMFFKDEKNNVVAKINGTHCIAYAEK